MENNWKSGIGPPEVTGLADKSKVRIKILLYLDHAGTECSAFEISNDTGICYSHVRGGLNGFKGRWSGKKSLVSTGLVQTRCLDNTVILYALTDRGRDAVRLIKFREGNHDRDVPVDQEV